MTTSSLVPADGEVPLLRAEEEVALAVRIEAGVYAARLLADGGHEEATDAELRWLVTDGEQARAALIAANTRLAASVARKYASRGVSVEDVYADAYHGLVRAADRFDYTKGVKFSTYAMFWIREAILTGLRSMTGLRYPEVLWNRIVKVRAVSMRLEEDLLRPATVEEIAAASGLSVRDVIRCQREDRPVFSLDAATDTGGSAADVLPDEQSPAAFARVEQEVDQSLLREALAGSLSTLPDLARRVLSARYGLDGSPARTITATAAELGMTRRAVRAEETRALRELRDHGHPEHLDGHL